MIPPPKDKAPSSSSLTLAAIKQEACESPRYGFTARDACGCSDPDQHRLRSTISSLVRELEQAQLALSQAQHDRDQWKEEAEIRSRETERVCAEKTEMFLSEKRLKEAAHERIAELENECQYLENLLPDVPSHELARLRGLLERAKQLLERVMQTPLIKHPVPSTWSQKDAELFDEVIPSFVEEVGR